MIGIDQVVVALWFFPVVAFIVLLSIAFVGFLVYIWGVFKPRAGQKRQTTNPVSNRSGKEFV